MKPVNRPPPEGEERLAVECRFWSKVDKGGSDECWPWLACRNQNGYGQFRLDYYTLYAQRVAWWLANGPIPEELCVLHHCDNPSCLNPVHLFLGTHADNVADKVRKGRQSRGESRPAAKLTEEDVRAIRKEYASTPATQKELGRKYGVDQTAISMVVNWTTWKHVK